MATEMDAAPAPPVLCLCGPTASGKSSLAMALAERWPLEIVSMDSALVYRGLDIGTAKPTPEERGRVPHHLIDIRDPWNPYSAAEFVRDARSAIADIRSRGRQVLLVGGTFLYLKALVDGLDPLPAADAQVRLALEAEAAERGWAALHRELAAVDPDTAARLAPGDAQRIQRALEVWRLTGKPLSALHRGARVSTEPAPALIAWVPSDRAWLRDRIDERLRTMWAAGFVQEVRRLRADPRVPLDGPALRAVGYRQTVEALALADAGTAATPLEADARAMQALHERCAAATRQLAKRQMTWLRSFSQRIELACDAENSRQSAIDLAFMHWRSP